MKKIALIFLLIKKIFSFLFLENRNDKIDLNLMGCLEKALSITVIRIALTIFKQLKLRFYYMNDNALEIMQNATIF